MFHRFGRRWSCHMRMHQSVRLVPLLVTCGTILMKMRRRDIMTTTLWRRSELLNLSFFCFEIYSSESFSIDLLCIVFSHHTCLPLSAARWNISVIVTRIVWCLVLLRVEEEFVVGRQSTRRSCRHICRRLDWRHQTLWNLAVGRVEFKASRQCLLRYMCLSLLWMTSVEVVYLTSHRSGQVARKYLLIRPSPSQSSPLPLLYHWLQSTGMLHSSIPPFHSYCLSLQWMSSVV